MGHMTFEDAGKPIDDPDRLPMLWYGEEVDANQYSYHRLPDDQREQMCELARRHGFSPDDVFRIEYDVIDCPMLRIHTYLRDDNGRVQLFDDRSHFQSTVTDVALRGNLPSWWLPT